MRLGFRAHIQCSPLNSNLLNTKFKFFQILYIEPIHKFELVLHYPLRMRMG